MKNKVFIIYSTIVISLFINQIYAQNVFLKDDDGKMERRGILSSRIEFPKIQASWESHRLDWCLINGKRDTCGKEAADAYCKEIGLGYAIGFDIDPDIGKESPTVTLRGKIMCYEGECDGFRYIVCAY